jgi:hypothetical protein
MTNFVFTMTTGRSGTLYPAQLLAQNLPDAECYHEIVGWDRFGVDTPDLSHMTLFNSQGNVEKVQAFWRSKLARIAATPRQLYVETLGKIDAAEEGRIRDLIASVESDPSVVAAESLRTSFSDAA